MEPIGFSAWLGYHAGLTGQAVPAAGTDRRANLAAGWARGVDAGYGERDFRRASDEAVAAATPEGALARLLPW